MESFEDRLRRELTGAADGGSTEEPKPVSSVEKSLALGIELYETELKQRLETAATVLNLDQWEENRQEHSAAFRASSSNTQNGVKLTIAGHPGEVIFGIWSIINRSSFCHLEHTTTVGEYGIEGKDETVKLVEDALVNCARELRNMT